MDDMISAIRKIYTYNKRMLLSKYPFTILSKYSKFINQLNDVESFNDEYKYDKWVNMIYNPNSDIGKNLYLTGKFEENEINFSETLLQTYQPGTVLDIGANIGLHVINWSKKVDKHHYFAFEPTRIVHSVLSQNIKINNISNRVTTIEKAISNQVGLAKFYETSDDAYNSLKDTKRKTVKNVYEVTITTVDKFVDDNKISDLRFVKIDTEGFEDEVIEGAINTIRKYNPTFFIEIYKGTDSNIHPEKTINKMINFGYNAYVFKNNRLDNFLEHNDKYYNYFFSFAKLI